MPSRLAALVLSAIIVFGIANADTLTVHGEQLYTLHYQWGGSSPPQYVPIDTSMSDTIWVRWDSTHWWWMSQMQFVEFHYPTTLAACDCLWFVISAINLSDSSLLGRNGLSMQMNPRDSTDISPFVFYPIRYWAQDFTLDTIPFGTLYEHHTLRGHYTILRNDLRRDYPASNRIILGVEANVWNRHVVVDATMYWVVPHESVPEHGERNPPFAVSVYPNPTTDGFSYRGPEARYRVFNILGQTVTEGLLTKNGWVGLANAPPGTYFLKLDNPRAQQPIITVQKVR
jgi:hypothetical protein